MIGWIRGETSTLLNHLRRCEHQPQDVQGEAEIAYWVRKRTAAATVAFPAVQDGTPNFLPLDVTQGTPGPGYLPIPFVNAPNFYQGPTSSGGSTPAESRANSPYPDSLIIRQSGSRSSSVARSSRSSAVRSSSIARSSSVTAHSANRNSHAEWSVDRQNTFNTRLGRLTASAGLPISWIENPEFTLFCQEFVHPSANIPSRKVLTRRILPTIKREFRKKAQAAIKRGSNATIQGDGWSAINEHHLNAFMMTVERKVCHVRL